MADDIYTVVLGDTLSEIAWKFNSTYNYGSTAIAAAQRLGAINDIKAKVIKQSIDCSSGCKVTETAKFTAKLWG